MELEFTFKATGDVPLRGIISQIIILDFDYNRYDTLLQALKMLLAVRKSRDVWTKLKADQKAIVEDAINRLTTTHTQDYITYTVVRHDEKTMIIRLNISPELLKMYEDLKRYLPWFYRKPLDILVTPERLVKKMVKIGLDEYGPLGIEVDGQVIKE